MTLKGFSSIALVACCGLLLASCGKHSDQQQAQGGSVTISAKNIDLSKAVQPCTTDGAKIAGLKAGQGNASVSQDYAKDNNCTQNASALNSTYQQYVTKGQQLKGLGIQSKS